MIERRALWVGALLGIAAMAAQAQAAVAPAGATTTTVSTTTAAKDAAKDAGRDAVPARGAESEAPRRLKFKGRAGNCLCADPITDEEIDAAAARQNEASTKTQNPRSKP